MRDRRITLLYEIRALIAAPDAGEASPPVARLEEVLTSGYAHALALEAERLRLEQQLGTAARELGNGANGNGHMTELAEQIALAEGDLTRLRALLVVLRDRTRAARAAAPATR